jgi:hypothetical protein
MQDAPARHADGTAARRGLAGDQGTRPAREGRAERVCFLAATSGPVAMPIGGEADGSAPAGSEGRRGSGGGAGE